MDVWALPTGHELDLGPLPGPMRTELALASHLLAVLDDRLAGSDGAVLDGLVWYPSSAGGDLRLQVSEPGQVRLLAVDRDGTTRPILDVRFRRPSGNSGSSALLTTPLQPGDNIERQYAVDADRLTDHVPGARPVLATPDLIGWLEDTAASLLRPRFAAGTSSLGTWIGIRHTGPAWLGERVDVRAAVAAVHGRRFLFDVRARVGDRPIAGGQVAQTLIRAA
jgi:predicted thioesterase